jgi:hypothetical protein
MYTTEFDEAKVRSSPAFNEVWDIDCPIENLSGKGYAFLSSRLNPERFSN